jgi:hypothetical protein
MRIRMYNTAVLANVALHLIICPGKVRAWTEIIALRIFG